MEFVVLGMRLMFILCAQSQNHSEAGIRLAGAGAGRGAGHSLAIANKPMK